MANPITANGNHDEPFSNPAELWGTRVVVGLSGTFDSANIKVRYLVGSDECKFDQTDEPTFTSGGGVTVTIPQKATALRFYVTTIVTAADVTYTYTKIKNDSTY